MENLTGRRAMGFQLDPSDLTSMPSTFVVNGSSRFSSRADSQPVACSPSPWASPAPLSRPEKSNAPDTGVVNEPTSSVVTELFVAPPRPHANST